MNEHWKKLFRFQFSLACIWLKICPDDVCMIHTTCSLFWSHHLWAVFLTLDSVKTCILPLISVTWLQPTELLQLMFPLHCSAIRSGQLEQAEEIVQQDNWGQEKGRSLVLSPLKMKGVPRKDPTPTLNYNYQSSWSLPPLNKHVFWPRICQELYSSVKKKEKGRDGSDGNFSLQKKEADGNDSTVPKEITDNLDQLTEEQLKVWNVRKAQNVEKKHRLE